MKKNRPLLVLPVLLTLAPLAARAATIESTASGNWAAPGTWAGGAVPLPGNADTANINAGHTVIFTNEAPFAGLSGSNDLGVGNNNTININGGVLSQAMDGWWVRIGHAGTGTLNINDGRFHITDSTGTGGTNLQVGVVAGGNGIINVGDNTGADNSAVLNLRDLVSGTANSGTFNMNLGADTDTAGTVIINSDGVLEGDVRTLGGDPLAVTSDPHIRIGQASSNLQSVVRVNAGGQFNARGNVEIGAQGGSKGLLHLTGQAARMDMTGGGLTVGFTGAGEMVVENGAVFQRADTAAERQDLFVGRNATGVGTITLRSGGQFLRTTGGNVGDLRIGLAGQGTLNVEEGGVYRNESGNWDWVGQNAGSTGTINVTGGTFEITSGSNLMIGTDGTGNFTQTSGSTNVAGVRVGVNSGTGTISLSGGTFNVRNGLYLGGDSTTTGGNGTGNVVQSGGTMTIGGALVVGIAANHTGNYTMTGGSVQHDASDTTIGESGTGTLTIGAGATLTEGASSGMFLVGRNNGSRGTLIVNGTLTKAGANAIRVGNGDTAGVDNTDAPGFLGGTGTITSAGGVVIGARGTLSGGLTTTVGDLDINANLSFSAGGTLHADFDAASNVDTLAITGTVNITGAVLTGDWAPGAETGVDSRYWLISNDGTDAITGTFANAVAGSAFAGLYPDAGGFVTLDGQEFAVFYSADFGTNALTGGNDLLLSAVVPEPSATGLLLLAGLAAGRRRRSPGAAA